MKNLGIVAVILMGFLAYGFMETHNPPADPETKTSSLYDRLGGEEGISEIVDAAVKTHTENPTVSHIFLPYLEEPERLAKIKHHTVMFFSMGSGGTQEYQGRSMPDAHKGLNITAEQYMAVVDDIMLVLDQKGIDEESKKDVLAILWSLKGQIMNK